jgi:hypothetical protein
MRNFFAGSHTKLSALVGMLQEVYTSRFWKYFVFIIFTSVACAIGPQVLPLPQLIFPSKTWFFGNLFEFSMVEITF